MQAVSRIGGGYEAVQEDDGTWTVKNIPVFSAHTRDGFKFDKEWLEKAVVNSQKSFAEGYLGPIHENHHIKGADAGKTPSIGRFVLTKVAPIQFEGKSTPTIFADFHGISQANYERIKAGQLPYRSVELYNDSEVTHEIDTIALLSERPPYFKYSMLTIGKERKAQNLAFAYSKSGKSTTLLFKYEDKEKSMNGEEDKKKKTEEPEGEDKKEGGTMYQENMKPVMDLLTAMSAKFDAFIQAVTGQGATNPAQQAVAPVQMSKTPKEDAGELNAVKAMYEKKFDEMQKKVEKMESESNLNRNVDAAMKELSDYDADRDEVLTYAKQGDAILKAYVELNKKFKTTAPSDTFAIEQFSQEEVKTYGMDGPDGLERAKKLSKQYDLLPPSMKAGTNKNEWIKEMTSVTDKVIVNSR